MTNKPGNSITRARMLATILTKLLFLKFITSEIYYHKLEIFSIIMYKFMINTKKDFNFM